jgi:L-cysteate sulfo-lyase
MASHILLEHATGSAGPQAGLVAGLAGARTQIPVYGVGVRTAKAPQG